MKRSFAHAELSPESTQWTTYRAFVNKYDF